MEKLLETFLEECTNRGVMFKENKIIEIKRLAKEKNKSFYKKFQNLYDEFFNNLIIPENSYSFYIENNNENLNVIFFNETGNKIETLTFKNSDRKELEKFLFKQLIGGNK